MYMYKLNGFFIIILIVVHFLEVIINIFPTSFAYLPSTI